MSESSPRPAPTRPFAKPLAVVVATLSILGAVLGLVMVENLTSDFRGTITVTRSAMDVIADTVEAVDDIALDTSASLEATASSVSSASSTVDEAVVALDGVADFLERDLPSTLESIQTSMPAAIQTANAVDGALRALSLFGVDYDPSEPFGESLSRVNTALIGLPAEIRAQSAALRSLSPSAAELAAQTDTLATSLESLGQSLDGFTELTAAYESTIIQADATIVATEGSLDRSIWILRALVIGASSIGILVSLALWSLATRLEDLSGLVELIHHERAGSEVLT